MFKNLIAPIQAWLLSQKRCVGCGNDLSKGKVKEVRGKTTVTCKCGRIFIHDKAKNSYRRALFDEI
jgi:predicted  nucleic acid-binding Zn-ribbon protein